MKSKVVLRSASGPHCTSRFICAPSPSAEQLDVLACWTTQASFAQRPIIMLTDSLASSGSSHASSMIRRGSDRHCTGILPVADKDQMMSRHWHSPRCSIHSTATRWYQPGPVYGNTEVLLRRPKGPRSTKEKSDSTPGCAGRMLSSGLKTLKSWSEQASAFLRQRFTSISKVSSCFSLQSWARKTSGGGRGDIT